jgi:hypothetical protein
MQTKTQIIAAVCTIFLLLSCSQQEEIVAPQPVKLKQRAIQKNPISKFQYSIPTITPCGYGFKVNIQFFGNPSVPTFEYQIEDANNLVVDTGFVGDGMNTNWVLNPCQVYTFKYWAYGYGSPGAGDPPTTVITATSDGCGNVFIC